MPEWQLSNNFPKYANAEMHDWTHLHSICISFQHIRLIHKINSIAAQDQRIHYADVKEAGGSRCQGGHREYEDEGDEREDDCVGQEASGDEREGGQPTGQNQEEGMNMHLSCGLLPISGMECDLLLVDRYVMSKCGSG